MKAVEAERRTLRLGGWADAEWVEQGGLGEVCGMMGLSTDKFLYK